VLQDYEAELNKITARRTQAEMEERRQREALERARNGPTVIEKRLVRHSFSINFIPFGAGQFQNGQRRKGWAFLISESTLALVSVGALTTNLALYGFRPHRRCLSVTDVTLPCTPDYKEERRSQLITRVQVVSGGLFFAVAAWGIADAILHFKPEVPLARADASLAGSLQVAPLALDGGWGAGLAFRF
jgi:hypothetical protein